jgi:hypothetical protein
MVVNTRLKSSSRPAREGDKFIVVQRSARGRELISEVSHLGIVVGDRQPILLGHGESDVCVHRMRSCLRRV